MFNCCDAKLSLRPRTLSFFWVASVWRGARYLLLLCLFPQQLPYVWITINILLPGILWHTQERFPEVWYEIMLAIFNFTTQSHVSAGTVGHNCNSVRQVYWFQDRVYSTLLLKTYMCMGFNSGKSILYSRTSPHTSFFPPPTATILTAAATILTSRHTLEACKERLDCVLTTTGTRKSEWWLLMVIPTTEHKPLTLLCQLGSPCCVNWVFWGSTSHSPCNVNWGIPWCPGPGSAEQPEEKEVHERDTDEEVVCFWQIWCWLVKLKNPG